MTCTPSTRLRPLISAVGAVCAGARADGTDLPLLVKVSPDALDDDLVAVADLAVELGVDGLIVTNTTVGRDGLRSAAAQVERAGGGGLSGPPLRSRAAQILALLRAHVGDRLVLVGVGGIDTPQDAAARLSAGAALVQSYTGFVYGGPRLAVPGEHRSLTAHARTHGLFATTLVRTSTQVELQELSSQGFTST